MRLLYTDCYIASRILETLNGKMSGKTVLANHTILNLALKSGKVPTIVVSNTTLN